MMVAPHTKTHVWRIGALVLFLGLPLVLGGLAIENLAEASQSDELTARKTATTKAIVAQVEKHRAHHTKPVDTNSLYLASTSASLARADVQALATRLVGEAGGRVVETQLVETPEQDADGTVAIEVSLDIDNKGLRDLLYAVESGLPLLTVSDLSVQPASAQGDESGAAPGQLKVQMSVQGHWRKAAG